MLLVAFLVGLCMPVMADRYYTFNAAAVDVDGLPYQMNGFGSNMANAPGSVVINSSASYDDASSQMKETARKIAREGWSIMAMSRDYNYHNDLVTALNGLYQDAIHSGGFTTDISGAIEGTMGQVDADGVGFFVSKDNSFVELGKTNWTETEGEDIVSVGLQAFDAWRNGRSFDLEYDELDAFGKKGFRRYTVTLTTTDDDVNVAVDVYALHMDGGVNDADIAARNSQLTQLAQAIITNSANNNRPIIVMGRMNSYYSRENLADNFIDVINQQSHLEIKDAWIECTRSSVYPTSVADAQTKGFGPENGEKTSKIFYINNSNVIDGDEPVFSLSVNAYQIATYFDVEENPVVVSFTITEKTSKTDSSDRWKGDEEFKTQQKPKFEGEQVVNGTQYYMMNVGTGEYIKWGGAYYTQAVAGNGGTPIVPICNETTGYWALKTCNRTPQHTAFATGDNVFLDNKEGAGAWSFIPVDGTDMQYYIKCFENNKYLSVGSASHRPITTVDYNADDDNQKWIFLTDDRIRTEMAKANADHPFNFTALLKSADFDVIEYEDGWTNSWTGFDNNGTGTFKGYGTGWGPDPSLYSTFAAVENNANVSMSQSLGTLPNGNYRISFKGFYNTKAKYSNNSELLSYSVDAKVIFGNNKIAVTQNTGVGIADYGAAHQYFKTDNTVYLTEQSVALASSADVTLTVNKPKTPYNNSASAWMCIDDFKLLYYGTEGENPYIDYINQVVNKMNETHDKVFGNEEKGIEGLNEAGQRAYDISVVVYALQQGLVTSKELADVFCEMIDKAYLIALAAHRLHQQDPDITSTLINPSFETKDLTGWTKIGSGQDVAVQPNSNATYTTSGIDGSWLFNSWNGDTNKESASIQQTITFLKNGLYELKASLASFGANDQKVVDNEGNYVPYTVYIFGNSSHKGIQTTKGKGVFTDATLYFLVEDGIATIGAVGGDGGCEEDGDLFQYFDPNNGSFFKADNFRLKYVTDVPNGRVKLALDELREATIDAYGDEILNLDQYQLSIVNGVENVPTGYTYAAANDVVEELRSKVIEAGKAQGRKYNEKTDPSDMTWAIENPSFETGDFTGWTVNRDAWEAVIGDHYDRFRAIGAEGRYLFNMYNSTDKGATGSAENNYPISQQITGIKNGRYRLSAMVASNTGNTIFIAAKDGVAEDYTKNSVIATAADYMKRVSVEFEVKDHKATIMVAGGKGTEWNGDKGGCWYKVDDFHLQYIGHELELNDTETTPFDVYDNKDWYTDVTVNRTFKGNSTWSSFVLPFNMDVPEGWQVKQLTRSVYSNDKITMYFEAVDEIKAGVAYMVRFVGKDTNGNDLVETGVSKVDVDYVDVDEETDNPGTNDIEFVGVYSKQKVPVGSFYISNNVFKQAVEGGQPDIKAFRAYFKPKVANVRSMAFRSGEDTSIDAANNEEVTVVGIYDVNGMRLTDMQDGINILQMSNGTTMKIIMK